MVKNIGCSKDDFPIIVPTDTLKSSFDNPTESFLTDDRKVYSQPQKTVKKIKGRKNLPPTCTSGYVECSIGKRVQYSRSWAEFFTLNIRA